MINISIFLCSKTYRDRGNKAYAKKDLNAAMAFYCKAIVCAPLDPDGRGREVSLSLGNRSAVFFEMAEWKKCLADIEVIHLILIRLLVCLSSPNIFLHPIDLKNLNTLFLIILDVIKFYSYY